MLFKPGATYHPELSLSQILPQKPMNFFLFFIFLLHTTSQRKPLPTGPFVKVEGKVTTKQREMLWEFSHLLRQYACADLFGHDVIYITSTC